MKIIQTQYNSWDLDPDKGEMLIGQRLIKNNHTFKK